jgi:hypothetical protein
MNKTPKRRKSTKRLIDVKEKHAWQRIICHHLQKKKKKKGSGRLTSDPIMPRVTFPSRGKSWPHMTPCEPSLSVPIYDTCTSLVLL